MAKMLSVQVEDSLAKTIDRAIQASGLYSSRSEFLKDAIRKNLFEVSMARESFREIHEGFEELRKLAKSRGYDGKMPTKAERKAIAREFVKKHNIR